MRLLALRPMLGSLFDYPLYVTGPVILVSLSAYAIGGLILVRSFALPRMRIKIDDSEFSGAMSQGVMVFYGLAIALIAVNVFDDHSDVSKIVSDEATNLGSLYRDVSGYPDPVRGELQAELREYTYQVITQAWPLQRRGQVPSVGVQYMNRFQAKLIAFEPGTEGQKLLHAETLSAYNSMIHARRLRLDAVDTGLPFVMWLTVVVGAMISMTACFFFKVEEVRLHVIMVMLLAIFIGLVIFMILALDRPFRGDLGVGPEPYQLIYTQLMNP